MDSFCTYEQYFSLSGQPFSTDPDPDSYFECRGHGRAFTHVKHAVLAGEGFIVVTGDPGTGKTILVRELLRELASEGVVIALPNKAALDARGVLLAILSSFRAQASEDSLDALRAVLHAHLTALDTIGGRALMVVDDAQELLPDAVDELIRFATPQWADDAPLQVLLVGEPALRASLPDMAQMTPRPTVLFCDIGALSRSETRAYIEHRLQIVEWHKSPSFSDDTHQRIYGSTGGVPLQVNRLCHSLLMAAYRQELTSISPELVDEVNAELRDEISGTAVADVLKMPAFVPEKRLYRLDPKIRHAIASHGWIVLPVLVVAGFMGSPSEKSVLPTLLSGAPRATAQAATSTGSNAARLARGDTGPQRKFPDTAAGGLAPRPLVAPLPLQVLLAAQLDEVRAKRARDDPRLGLRRTTIVAVHRGTERIVTTVDRNETRRAASAANRRATSRAGHAASKPRTADAQRTSVGNLASR